MRKSRLSPGSGDLDYTSSSHIRSLQAKIRRSVRFDCVPRGVGCGSLDVLRRVELGAYLIEQCLVRAGPVPRRPHWRMDWSRFNLPPPAPARLPISFLVSGASSCDGLALSSSVSVDAAVFWSALRFAFSRFASAVPSVCVVSHCGRCGWMLFGAVHGGGRCPSSGVSVSLLPGEVRCASRTCPSASCTTAYPRFSVIAA